MTFGEDNVVGAHLHMDEQTPHLHVTVVPIVTTERKNKAKESNARKHYRTKPKNEPRHVDQHEYYRQCQIEKKGLEQDMAKLYTEKKKTKPGKNRA
ncbi:MAG: plasmid recombination protein [Muribaculaceae bacterium]|nr:plasmid recombination protein [Muribaculaceae bacterium]